MAFASVTSLDHLLDSTKPRPASPFKTQLIVQEGEIYVFDFDGVISSNFEDQLYKAPAWPGEVEITSAAARAMGVHCEGMDYRYQRHLVYQAALWRIGAPIQPGPAFIHAKQAGEIAQLFVLTARSGWFAVERFRDFLRSRAIVPVETFNVGRVSKALQIELLCKQFPEKTINFVEDSPEHLADVIAANPGNVRPVLVSDESGERYSHEYLMTHYTDTLSTVLGLDGSEF